MHILWVSVRVHFKLIIVTVLITESHHDTNLGAIPLTKDFEHSTNIESNSVTRNGAELRATGRQRCLDMREVRMVPSWIMLLRETVEQFLAYFARRKGTDKKKMMAVFRRSVVGKAKSVSSLSLSSLASNASFEPV